MRLIFVSYINLTLGLENLPLIFKFLQWTLFVKFQLYNVFSCFSFLAQWVFMINTDF